VEWNYFRSAPRGGKAAMIDVFDIFAFGAFAAFIALAVIIVVTLGQLPGRIARKQGHPQAAAINVAGWLGVATLGLLWPVALIWAFLKPVAVVSKGEVRP
jgi:hypothetical protein